jgi:Undecaprenyl-phosphate galactose phosphotransferase WbaP
MINNKFEEIKSQASSECNEKPTFRAQPPLERSNRSLLILFILAIIAVGLMTLPHQTAYYAKIVVEADDGTQLNFWLNHQQDKYVCDKTVANVINSITKNCLECSIKSQTCTDELTAEMQKLFSEVPVPIASAQIANGVITYTSPQEGKALTTCQESQRQATLMGNQVKFTCFAAGSVRTKFLASKQQAKASYTTFTLLLALYGGLIVSLVVAILVAYYQKRSLNSDNSALDSHPWLEKLTLASVDTLILVGTFLAISWPVNSEINNWNQLDRATVISHGVVIFVTVGWFWLILEHYARRRPFWDELREITHVLTIMFIATSATAFLMGTNLAETESTRSDLFIVWSLNLILVPLARASLKSLLNDIGLWKRPALIIGTGENAREAYLAIKSERAMGYHMLGFVSTLDEPSNEVINNITINSNTLPVFAYTNHIESQHDQLKNVQIIVALDSLNDEKSQLLVKKILNHHTNVNIIPSIRGLPLFGTQLSHFFSHEVLFLTIRNNLARRGFIWIKRIFDLVAATILLIILSPLFLILIYLIRRDGGKAFYGHTRVGKNGKLFKCLKFRSMRSDADKVLKDLLENDPVARAEWDKDFKLKNDPRITAVGHFLRKTSLDELPQLINVLKHEMSLVGPRPIVTAELERYGDYVNLYLQVLPGITGLWQVSGRNDTSYDQRVSLDAWYVQNWSMWYDIAILFKTVNVVVNRRGAY